MTANILARQFKIEFSDYYSIDISPDIHINRVLCRMGFIPQKADKFSHAYSADNFHHKFA